MLGFAGGFYASVYLGTLGLHRYAEGASSLIIGLAPALYQLSIISTFSFAILLTYSAWRMSLESHGFRRAAVAASGGFAAFLGYLSLTDEAFRRARLLMLPLSAALFVLALIAAFFMRLNRQRQGRSRRHGRR